MLLDAPFGQHSSLIDMIDKPNKTRQGERI